MNSSKICRLCLKSCKANFLPVEEITKQILEYLLVKVDWDKSENPINCKECIEKIQKCFDLKTFCILTEENIISVLKAKNIYNTNMTQVYLKHMEEVCRFCTKSVATFFTIDELDKDINFCNMIQKFLPEVQLSVTNNPVTCSNCLNSLKSYFTFLKKCQDVEEYIEVYCKAGNMTENKVRLHNVAQYTLKHIMFKSNAERDVSRLKKEDFEEVTVTKNEIYSPVPVKTEIIIKEEEIIETNSTNIIDVNTITTEESQPVDIYSSDSAITETFVNGQLFKKCSCSIVSSVKTEVFIKEEQIYEKNSVDSIDMDTITTKEQLVEPLSSERDLPIEEIKNENSDDDNDVFSEDCSDKSNTEDIEMVEIKMEDTDIESKNNKERNAVSPKELQCSYCNYKGHMKNLTLHLKRFHRTPILPCHLCPYKTYHEDCLKRHLERHKRKQNNKNFECPQCQTVSRNRVNFDNHLLKKHNSRDLLTSKIYSCKICGFKTTVKYSFLNHMNTQHSRLEKFQCSYCLRTFFQKDCLRQHISSVHLNLKPHICEECKRTFARKFNLDSHIVSRHHQNLGLMETVERTIYNCSHCNYKSICLTYMGRHMESH